MLKRIPFTTVAVVLGATAVAAILLLQVLRTGGLPDPTGHGDFGARVLDIAVLVFREGLECILVLSAITANMVGARRSLQRPVAAGAAGGVWGSPPPSGLPLRPAANPPAKMPAPRVCAATRPLP